MGISQSQAGAQSFDPLSPELKQKILERDSHTCAYCGFEAKKYQEVRPLDGNINNQKIDNLITACIFCNQCFDLQKTSEMRSGVLIWLPEMSQAELNHVARAIYVARISQGTMAESAKGAYKLLIDRREIAKERIKTDDPFILATVMQDFLGPRHYAMRAEKLDGMRLFPLDRRIVKESELEFNQFPQILAYWRSKDGPFGGKPPAQWKNFYAKVKQAA